MKHLILLCLLILTACGTSGGGSSDTKAAQPAQTPLVTPTPSPEPAPMPFPVSAPSSAPSPSPAPAPAPSPSPAPIPELTCMDIAPAVVLCAWNMESTTMDMAELQAMFGFSGANYVSVESVVNHLNVTPDGVSCDARTEPNCYADSVCVTVSYGPTETRATRCGNVFDVDHHYLGVQ